MRSGRAIRILCLSLAALSISGCATFEGSPRRLLNDNVSMGLVNRYQIDDAILNFSQPDTAEGNEAREGLNRQQYRDMVVIVYMNAMDSRYHEFRIGLSSERRQTNFALDLAVLGFTGWASVARESIVNNLSAIAAGFAGARSSIDTNLYYHQTLPALIAAMDAQRLRARAQMMIRLQRPANDYPLPTAFADLMSYEVSSTLDGAISQITGDAAQDRQAAQEELQAVTTACHAETGASEVSDKIMRYMRRTLAPDASGAVTEVQLVKLFKIATALGLTGSWTRGSEVYNAIRERISAGSAGVCGKAALEDMLARIQTATGDTIP